MEIFPNPQNLEQCIKSWSPVQCSADLVEAGRLAGVVPAVPRHDLGEAQHGDGGGDLVGEAAQLAGEVHQHLETRNIKLKYIEVKVSKFQELRH